MRYNHFWRFQYILLENIVKVGCRGLKAVPHEQVLVVKDTVEKYLRSESEDGVPERVELASSQNAQVGRDSAREPELLIEVTIENL